MDGDAISMITLPIFIPVVSQTVIDLLWFSLLFAINLTIGALTPPFAPALFYLQGTVRDVKMTDMYGAVMPYILVMVIVLAIGMAWPPLLLWLPGLMK